MSNYTITPLEGGLNNVNGFFSDATNVGMRTNPANSGITDVDGDVAFIRSNVPCNIAAVFTSNRFQAAPIKHFQRYEKGFQTNFVLVNAKNANAYEKGFQTNFVLVNAKNANAMTGEKGIEDIHTIMSALSSKIEVINPVMSSTGVIGYRLPVDRITSAFEKFDFNAKNSDAAAMATMLCFVITDADVPKADMDALLKNAADRSFNRISVDGDTSTNDTVMLLANGNSGNYNKEAFSKALNDMLFKLAMMILRDGEGANKLVTFEVTGAASNEEAERAARALSNSLLVKTALFGEDPNWGRIASTIGASGITCDDTTLTIHYNDLLIYSDTHRELDKEREKQAYTIMKQEAFTVRCDLGIGKAIIGKI